VLDINTLKKADLFCQRTMRSLFQGMLYWLLELQLKDD
jgi:hypothetical protein